MNKGFTLIELLSVIIILTIILVVAVPRIMKAVDSSKVNSYISNEKLLLKSTELYVSKNIESLPVNIGDTSEILLSDLISNGYIKDIKSPFNKNDSCSGYVLITKKNSDEYDYTPHINCLDNTITNSTQDKLLLHYKFDDFQEPTTNTFVNLNLSANRELTYQYVGIEDGWLKYSISGVGTSNTYPYSFSIMPMLIHSDYRTSVSYKYKTNVEQKYLTFSTAGMVNIVYKTGFSLENKNIGTYKETKVENVSPWKTTAEVPIIGQVGQAIYFSSRPKEGEVFNPETDFIYFKDVQVEIKSYSTPYVNGERTGTVNNYSSNNYNADLQLVSTPKWVNNSRGNSGAYQFNGINTIIDLTDKGLNNFDIYNGEATVSMWINPSKHSNGFARYMAGFHYWYINSSGKLQNMVNKPGDGVNYWLYGNTTIPIGVYTHVVYTIKDNEYVKYFVNGNLDAEHYSSTLEIINYPTNSAIGATHDGFFEGSIEDVRIYSRALSKDEINLLYNSTK